MPKRSCCRRLECKQHSRLMAQPKPPLWGLLAADTQFSSCFRCPQISTCCFLTRRHFFLLLLCLGDLILSVVLCACFKSLLKGPPVRSSSEIFEGILRDLGKFYDLWAEGNPQPPGHQTFLHPTSPVQLCAGFPSVTADLLGDQGLFLEDHKG